VTSDVWETREDADRFLAERIQPLIDEGPDAFPAAASFTPPTREGSYGLHDVVEQRPRVAVDEVPTRAAEC
jgi:hypothetical protein